MILGILISYAAMLGFAVPLLRRCTRWTVRSPSLGIWLWQALTVSWLVSSALIGLTLIMPWLWCQLAGCVVAPRLEDRPELLWCGATALFGALSALALAVRCGYRLTMDLIRERRLLRRHAGGLALVGRSLPGRGAVVLDSGVPAVYCVPGRDPGRRIVITSAALLVLRERELDAVIAHERAHLRGRHHLAAAIAASLARALPVVPVLAHARDQIGLLTEMAADDAACARHGRRTTAAALVSLARGRVAAPALGAGGDAVVERLRRILAPPPPLPLPARATGAGAGLGAMAFPIVAVLVACGSAILLILSRLAQP
jgi:Zn-dependent protease with chaperone function